MGSAAATPLEEQRLLILLEARQIFKRLQAATESQPWPQLLISSDLLDHMFQLTRSVQQPTANGNNTLSSYAGKSTAAAM